MAHDLLGETVAATAQYNDSIRGAASRSLSQRILWLLVLLALCGGLIQHAAAASSLGDRCRRLEQYLLELQARSKRSPRYVSVEVSGSAKGEPKFARDASALEIDAVVDGVVEAPLVLVAPDMPWRPAPYVRQGDRITATARLRVRSSGRAFGSVCRYGYSAVLSVPLPKQPARSRRVRLVSRLYNLLGVRDGLDLTLAMVLAERGVLSEKLHETFARLGMTHALVVSGFHVGVVCWFFSLAASALFTLWPRTLHFVSGAAVKSVFGALGASLYACVIGWNPTVSRAMIAVFYFSLARLLGRQSAGLRAIAIAFIVVSAIWPGAAASAGVQLTFSALIGLTIALNACRCAGIGSALLRRAAQAVLCCISAWLFTSPVVVCWFAEISLVGPAANVLFLFPLCVLAVGVCAPLVLLTAATAEGGQAEGICHWVLGRGLDLLELMLGAMSEAAQICGPQLALGTEAFAAAICCALICLTLVAVAALKLPQARAAGVPQAGGW